MNGAIVDNGSTMDSNFQQLITKLSPLSQLLPVAQQWKTIVKFGTIFSLGTIFAIGILDTNGSLMDCQCFQLHQSY